MQAPGRVRAKHQTDTELSAASCFQSLHDPPQAWKHLAWATLGQSRHNRKLEQRAGADVGEKIVAVVTRFGHVVKIIIPWSAARASRGRSTLVHGSLGRRPAKMSACLVSSSSASPLADAQTGARC